MSEKQKETEEKKEGKAFAICYFKVPVSIKEDPNEGTLASFKEVDHKDKCFKITEITFQTSEEAIAESAKLAGENNKTLKLAAKINKDGDIITRVTLCNVGDVKVNEELNK